MHTALIAKDGEKMSKSLGNLVFVDKLRTSTTRRSIRLGDHRAPLPHRWEWDDELMPRNAERLEALARRADGRAQRCCSTRSASASTTTSTRPARSRLIDDAARRRPAAHVAAAALLGVDLDLTWSNAGDYADVVSVATPAVHTEFNRIDTPGRHGCPTLRDMSERVPAPARCSARTRADRGARSSRGCGTSTCEGYERLPADGPAILCPNHISFLDSAFLMLTVPRNISFVGKAEYMDSWKTKYLFPAMGMIPIDRSRRRQEPRPRSTPPRTCCAAASCSASSPRARAAATATSTRAAPAPPGWR